MLRRGVQRSTQRHCRNDGCRRRDPRLTVGPLLGGRRMHMTKLNVNGVEHEVDAEPDTPLLWVLRDHLNLTGTKYGCGIAQCGACAVHVDGQIRRSCVLPLAGVGASKVVTIEGLSTDGSHPVQRMWVEEDVPQCGYCQSGQIMAAVALLRDKPKPTDS